MFHFSLTSQNIIHVQIYMKWSLILEVSFVRISTPWPLLLRPSLAAHVSLVLSITYCVAVVVFVSLGAKASLSVMCVYPSSHLTHLLIFIILSNYSSNNIFNQTLRVIITQFLANISLAWWGNGMQIFSWNILLNIHA